MLHRFTALASSTVVAAMLALPSAAAGNPDLAGTFTRSASAVEKQAVEAAVNKAAEQFNPVIRFIARGRLANAAKLPDRLQITIKGSQIGIRKDSMPMRLTYGDGAAITFTHDGKSTRLTRQASGNSITETAKTDDGSRTLVYSLSADGRTLTVSSTIESTQLKTPMHFNATYQRSGN